MKELSVSYCYQDEDIINFVLDSFAFEKIRCCLFLIFNLSSFLIGLICFFKNQQALGCILLAISILFFPLILYITFITTKKSISILKNVYCTLKENGMNFISDLGDVTFGYNELYDIKVTENLIFVYKTKKQALIIPKRAFNNKEKAINFASALLAKFNDSKHLQVQ